MKKCDKCNLTFENDKNIQCPRCKSTLRNLTKDELNKIRIRGMIPYIIVGFFIIVGIITFVSKMVDSSTNQPTYLSDVRCSWCSKVIRADGKNIHGHVTSFSDEFLECEYCGHNTKITK